jgi:NTP pyrophosphatase (non-canonical NTP hydrolase)
VEEVRSCSPLSVKLFQDAMREAYYQRDSERGLFKTFAWLVEEVGELAEALLSGDKSSIEEAIADVIAWTFSVANLVGVDVEKALWRKYKGDIERVGGSCSGGSP